AGHVAYGNSTSAGYTYDGGARLTAKSLAGPSGPLAELGYGWNDLFELTGIKDGLTPSKTQTFGYDPVGRLAQASGSYPQKIYKYDGGGNIELKDGVTYESDGYRVTQGAANGQKVFAAAYDANGNMVSAERNGQGATYRYDGDNQLVQSGGVTMSYDHAGRRVVKSVAGGPTIYYVAPHYQVAVFPDGSRQRTRFIFGDDGLVASMTDVEAGSPPQTAGLPAPGTFYLHKDHILSTLVQTDDAGRLVTSISYEPYGEIGAVEGADTLQQKFTGKEWDDAAGLYYFGARYYDPFIGRFITPDDRLGAPLGRRDALNRYAYVINDPVNNFDPTGHSIFSDIISYAVDGLLIVGGIAAMALGGPVGAVVGGAMLGAGVSGLASNISTQVSGKQFSWAGWGEQLGIGAATGLIAGGIAVGAGAVVDSLAEAGNAAFKIGQVGRLAVNVTAGVVGNAGANMVGTVLNNLATHASLTSGLGSSALLGAVLGGAAAGLSEGVASKLSRVVTMDTAATEEDERLVQNTIWQSNSLAGDTMPYARVLDATMRNNVLLTLPGVGFSAIGAGFSVLQAKGWWPQWP
ncbi:MAG TPA: RHS repeat-associated core domain-containing protein, partial [Pyrinomonadaceae bacterium]|nr:RHS repeat-associated core domain-containing protein [Pyrinomonadaceae bacterium]